jgi:hypothetical protein
MDNSVDVVVRISVEEYARLRAAEAKLQALEEAGVDNWEGYSWAMELLALNGENND